MKLVKAKRIMISLQPNELEMLDRCRTDRTESGGGVSCYGDYFRRLLYVDYQRKTTRKSALTSEQVNALSSEHRRGGGRGNAKKALEPLDMQVHIARENDDFEIFFPSTPNSQTR